MGDARRPGDTHTVAVGASFGAGAVGLHSLRYSFKPSSAAAAPAGTLTLRDREAHLSVPLGGGAPPLNFTGHADATKTSECALICDADGSWRLERLGRSIKDLKPDRSPTPPVPAIIPAAIIPVVGVKRKEPEVPEAFDADDDVSARDLFGDDDSQPPLDA